MEEEILEEKRKEYVIQVDKKVGKGKIVLDRSI